MLLLVYTHQEDNLSAVPETILDTTNSHSLHQPPHHQNVQLGHLPLHVRMLRREAQIPVPVRPPGRLRILQRQRANRQGGVVLRPAVSLWAMQAHGISVGTSS